MYILSASDVARGRQRASTLLRHHHIIYVVNAYSRPKRMGVVEKGGESMWMKIVLRCDSSASVYAWMCVCLHFYRCVHDPRRICVRVWVWMAWMNGGSDVRGLPPIFPVLRFTCVHVFYEWTEKSIFIFIVITIVVVVRCRCRRCCSYIVEALFRSLDYPFIRWASSRPLHFLVRLAVLCSWRGQLL